MIFWNKISCSLVLYISNETLCFKIGQEMCAWGRFESLWESLRSLKTTPFITVYESLSDEGFR